MVYALKNCCNPMLEATDIERVALGKEIWREYSARPRIFQPLVQHYARLVGLYVENKHNFGIDSLKAEMLKNNVSQDDPWMQLQFCRAYGERGDVTNTRFHVNRLVLLDEVGDFSFRESPTESRLDRSATDTGLLSSAYKALATAYIRNGSIDGALALLAELEDAGLPPQERTGLYVLILDAAYYAGNVKIAEAAYQDMREKGVAASIGILNRLIGTFGVAGDIQQMTKAMRVRFDMGFRVPPERESAFFQACLSGDFEAAGEVYQEYDDNAAPNRNTVIDLLNAFRIRGMDVRAMGLLELMTGSNKLVAHVSNRLVASTAMGVFEAVGAAETALGYATFLKEQDIDGRVPENIIAAGLRAVTTSATNLIEKSFISKESQLNTYPRLCKVEKGFRTMISSCPRTSRGEGLRGLSTQLTDAGLTVAASLRHPDAARSRIDQVDKAVASKAIRFMHSSDDEVLTARLSAVRHTLGDSHTSSVERREATRYFNSRLLPRGFVVEGRMSLRCIAELLAVRLADGDEVGALATLNTASTGCSGIKAGSLYKPLIALWARDGRVMEASMTLAAAAARGITFEPRDFDPLLKRCRRDGDLKGAESILALLYEYDMPLFETAFKLIFETCCKAHSLPSVIELLRTAQPCEVLSDEVWGSLLVTLFHEFGFNAVTEGLGVLRLRGVEVRWTAEAIQQVESKKR